MMEKEFSHHDKWFIIFNSKRTAEWLLEWGSKLIFAPPLDKLFHDENKMYKIKNDDYRKYSRMYNGKLHISSYFFIEVPKADWKPNWQAEIDEYQAKRDKELSAKKA
jgi:hypothetical protein